MKPSLQACYQLLDVSPDCTMEELKRAHKDLAQVWHPDRFGTNEELQKKALGKIQEINSAYDQILEYRTKEREPASSDTSQTSKFSRTVTGRDSVRISPPLIPAKYRIIMLLGFGSFLVILLFMLSQKVLVTKTADGLPSATYVPQSVEIRDETYVQRQMLTDRLAQKLDPFLKKEIGSSTYTAEIELEIDAESKMILQTRINLIIKQPENQEANLQFRCNKSSIDRLKTVVARVARLVPSQGDRVEISCD